MAKEKKTDDFEASYNGDSIDRLMEQVSPEEQEETDVKMLLAAKIYKAMKQKGWTQTRFAEAANQHVSVVSKWLSGTHNFTVETLLSIQRMLGIRLLDIDEPKFKSLLDVKLTISSEIPASEDELHDIIYRTGGMKPTGIRQEFSVKS